MTKHVLTQGRDWVKRLTLAYLVFVAVICFMPQPDTGLPSTPGIQQFGRLVILLRPFNTLWSLGELTSLAQLVWVIAQNLLNVLLLYPLFLGWISLTPDQWTPKLVLKRAFLTSLTIEGTQVLLSLLFNANRVFEIDDLWTNTLGGYLAYLTYQYVFRKQPRVGRHR